MVEKPGKSFKKSRKYGESAADLQDRLDFVASLLALKDGETTIPSDKLKAQFKLEWLKNGTELSVSGYIEQKQRDGQSEQIPKGITKKDLGVLLETYRHTTILESARDELIQNALACLRDLGILKEHESAKNQGYWKFSLFLKHETKREENLQVIRDAWKEAFGELPQPKAEPIPATLNRCILGLKGNYQDAQDKLTEITQTLQNLLNDKTLSIAKVEEGSILLIVESSQTGYEQLKRLIGQEIAGFPVEYAIDEWQDICRRMLIDRKPLTSNTVLGQVYGNRNLIDEDLFVDLALVKPKRSETEKHRQDIDPERGSDLFARQEVEKRFAYREFLDEIIGKRTEKQMAIIGEPGAGKTTLLQKLAFWLLQKTDDLVIWVDLAELGNQALGEYLEQKWLKEALGKSREEIKADWEQKFDQGAVWLLLDGLDEMSQSDQQALKFRGWVTDARIIVTCRLNLWQANPSQLQGFQTYLTQPFQDEQVQDFIRRWFRGLVESGVAVQLAESLWSELQAAGKERIKDLCRNPLLLTFLCTTWQLDKALPETTAELYADFVESIYEWKEKPFEVTEEEKERLNAALGKLAKASLDAETSHFRLTHRLVCEYLEKPKAKGSLFPLALRLGWLNEVGVAAENRREKVYGFYHATFQEYFAALAVEDWDDFLPNDHVDCPVEGKRYRIFEKQWKQVILFWLGREDVGGEEKEEFINNLVNFNDGCGEWNYDVILDKGFYEYRAYFLAAAGIAEFEACSQANDIVDKILELRFEYLNMRASKILMLVFRRANVALFETAAQIVKKHLIKLLDKNSDAHQDIAKVLDEIHKKNKGDSYLVYSLNAAIIEDEFIPTTTSSLLLELKFILKEAELNTSEIEVKINSLLDSVITNRNSVELQQSTEFFKKILFMSKIKKDLAKILQINWTSRLYLFPKVITALKNCISEENFENDFNQFDKCYEIIWYCAQNLSYPEFYQAWYKPLPTPHPEITDQTPHNSETTFAPINLAQTLQNQPILILNADLLANETRESEIALTLSELIWDIICPDQDPPETATPAQLRRHMKQLQRRDLLPHRALLLTDCEHPTPELIAFCEKLTGVIAIAFLTEDPLDAPLKGFPPNQTNLISAIETWLEEI